MTQDSHTQQSILQAIEQALSQAIAQHQAGQLKTAEDIYLGILNIQPNHPEANHNMGVLAVQKQQPATGLPYFMAAIDADPVRGQYWLSYIDALSQADQLDAAREVLALAKQQGLQGDDVDALALRLAGNSQATPQNVKKQHVFNQMPAGPVSEKHSPTPQESYTLLELFNAGRLTEAATLAQTMTERFPQHDFGWKVLGAALQQMGRSADALTPMRRAAALAPDDAESHFNLGVSQEHLGLLDEAETSYRQALQISPNYAEAHGNLGNILLNLGRLNEAEASYRCALHINPNHVKVHSNLGAALQALGRLDESEASYQRALQIKPDYAGAHSNLGITLQDMGRLTEAEASYRRALESNPNHVEAHSNLLFCLSQHTTLDAETLFAEHLRFGSQFESPLLAHRLPHTNSRDPNRRLQIGFVSGDLRDHAVAYFIEPVLKHLSGYPQLSLHAYSNHSMDDRLTERLRGYFAHWHPIASLSDAALAEKVRADHIDILIDLSGHTAKNRLLTFARKPAPVQATWMGYPGTTGLSAMDYYFSDRNLLPPGLFDDQFTEKIVRLPASAPFLPSQDAPPVNALPALGNAHVTFGSFNRLSKLSPGVIALWSQLLRALPDSRMVLGGMPADGKYEMLIEWFAQEGIARERLDFHPRSSMSSYLMLHQQVDICLDTFPYNGGTTTLNALWMGVPTLTLAGSTTAGRSGASILAHVGLEAFVASDAADFVRKGLFWAADLSALSDIRTGSRERFTQSTPGHPELITAGLERALRIMWQRWCADLPVQSFEVT